MFHRLLLTKLFKFSGKIENTDEGKVLNTKKQIKSQRRHIPKFRLKTAGDNASLCTASEKRVPLMLTDIQHLLLHSLLGNLNLSQSPRWYVLDKCNKISQTTCLIVEGVSIQHWLNQQHNLPFVKNTFNDFVEILTPSVYKGSLAQELVLVPLSEVEKESLIQKYGSINLALEARKDLMVMMKAIFPVRGDVTETVSPHGDDKFPRTQLILSAWQLIEESYPLPLKGKLKDVYADYVMTKDNYQPVTAKSPMFGLDCEMCMTCAGSELTRVSVVNEKLETVYESLVKPYNDVVDYLTRYSGITESMLCNVTKRLEDVQKDLRELLPPDAILIGQSLNADLHALKMMHPYVIDTSLIFNFTGERTRKPKLKTLAKELLNEDIQSGKNGHCSVEDSITTIKLVQLKLSKTMEYGDAVHTNRQQYKENVIQMAKKPQLAMSIFNRMIEQKKSSLIIGCDDITGDYHTYLTEAKKSFNSQLKKGKPKKVKLNTVDETEEVISTLCNAAKVNNYVMAHLRLNVTNENESDQMQKINRWIETTWNNLEDAALCVVVFGGTTSDNGMGMIKVKNSSSLRV